MGNCLITKLQGVVDNPTLPIFDWCAEVNGVKTSVDSQYVPLMTSSLKRNNVIIDIDFTANYVTKLSSMFASAFTGIEIVQNYDTISAVYQSGQQVTNLLSSGTRYTLIANSSTKKITINGTQYDWHINPSSTDNLSQITLFGWKTASGYSSASKEGFTTIHSIKIKNASTNEIIADLIPCKNKNNEGLLFDKITSEKYYPASGTLIVLE